MKTQYHVLLAFILGFAAFSTQVSATIIFTDNFSSDTVTGTSVVAPTGTNQLIKWAVTAGNVDLLGPVFAVGLCDGGAGKCLDIVGNAHGSITTRNSFNLVAGNYTFEFKYGNNTGLDNLLGFSVGSLLTASSVNASTVCTGTACNNFAHPTFSETFNVLTDTTVNINFSALGADNGDGGAILDSVTLTQNSVASVPEPATLALLAFGLAGIGFMRRQIL